MEGSSNQNIHQNTTPTPEAELNPKRVQALLNKLHEEFNASKTETDPIKVQEHLAKVDKIKKVLKIYHDQQKQRQGISLSNGAPNQLQPQQSDHQPTRLANAQPVSNLAPVAGSPTVPSPVPPLLSSSQNPQVTSEGTVRSQSPQVQSPAPQRASSNTPDAQKITIEKYNQVKSVLKDLAEKVQSLTLAKEKETDPVRRQAIDKSLAESRIQLQQYHKGALYMRKVLMDSGRLTANATPVPTPRPAAPQVATGGSASQPQATAERTVSTAPSNPIDQSQQIQSKQALPQSAPHSTTATNKKLPSPISAETKPTPSPSSTKPSAITKTSSTKAPAQTSTTTTTTPTTKRPQVSTNTTSTASSTNLVSSLKDFSSLPTVPTNIPDNGGRVLTKRKLNELITNLSVDQGDTKPIVDNDVEELFLDLADEFVRSVMGFSCNLAKHRKLDKVDIKDVQLNLERNWGIKVPGYMPDEIKPARRWTKKSDQKK